MSPVRAECLAAQPKSPECMELQNISILLAIFVLGVFPGILRRITSFLMKVLEGYDYVLGGLKKRYQNKNADFVDRAVACGLYWTLLGVPIAAVTIGLAALFAYSVLVKVGMAPPIR